jgi:hypothetical protein
MRLEAFLHSYYAPDLDIDQIAVYGAAGEVAGRLRAFAEKGMQHFMLGVPDLGEDQLERIAREVAPVVRA